MPIQQTYKTGTITVTSGSATVTGTGTFWLAGLVNGGDLSFKGNSIPIASVQSDTSLTLDYPAPAGMAGAGQYSIALGRADAASAIVANRQLADLTDLLRNRVSNFAATILDDTSGAAVRTTIGAAALADVTAALILSRLQTVDTDDAGINASTLKSVTPSALGLALLAASQGGAQTSLGMSAFFKTLLDAADGATLRGNIGAQATLGFQPVQQGTGVGQLPNVIKMGWNNAFLKATVDSTDLGRVWTDLEAPRSLAGTQVYQKLPGGLILQAGVANAGATDRSIVYPFAFSAVAFPFAIPYSAGTATTDWTTSYIVNFNSGSFTLANRQGGGVAKFAANFWAAIGY